MADREKLIDLRREGEEIAENFCVSKQECYQCPYNAPNGCKEGLIADHLIANGVTVQDSKVVEINQFKLPIDDAILILKEEHKQRVDGYTTHLSYGGKGDPAEEAHLDALEMAIAALEWQKRQMH